METNSNDSDSSLSSSSDSDDAIFSRSVNYLNSFDLHPKDGDYSKFKKEIENNLRIGSAYHIGTRAYPSFLLANVSSRAFTRHPFNLILAREQGDIGASNSARSLRYMNSQWVVDGTRRFDGLQVYGNRSKGVLNPDPQTFQERIQGSLWAVTRLHLENKFECHRGCVNALNFNSNGNLIASGSDDLKVVVTNWITGEQIFNYRTGHSMNIFHVKFVPESDDLKIVSCACDSEVRLATLSSTGDLLGPTRLLVSHNRACHKLALPKGEPNVVLSCGADGQVFCIDLRVPKASKLLWLPFSEFFSIACNPVRPHEFALCGRSESIVRIYDRRKVNKRDPSCGFIHFVGAQQLRGSDRSACVRDIEQLNPRLNLMRSLSNSEPDSDESSNEFLNSLSAQLGRRVRAVINGLRGRTRTVLRMNSDGPNSLFHNFEVTKYSATAGVYSAQGDSILVSYNDEDIYLFDVNDPSKPFLHKYSGHRNMQTIVSASFYGPNSEYVVSGSDDGFFYIWDRESEGIVQWLHADRDGAVNVIEAHPTLPVLATAGLDYDFKIWTPLRPVNADDDVTLDHFKYPSSKISPDILRLRRSRLAKMLFPDNETEKDKKLSSSWVSKVHELDVDCESPSLKSSSSSTSTPSGISIDPVGQTENNSQSLNEPSTISRKRRHSNSRPCTDSNVQDRTGSCDGLDNHMLSKRSLINPQLPDRENSPELMGPATKSTKLSMDGLNNDSLHSKRNYLRLPEKYVPFNQIDLQLRAAQNWINRACESNEIDGLDETSLRIISAIDSVTELHTDTRRRSEMNSINQINEVDGGNELDPVFSGPTVEISGESLATRDRDETLEECCSPTALVHIGFSVDSSRSSSPTTLNSSSSTFSTSSSDSSSSSSSSTISPPDSSGSASPNVPEFVSGFDQEPLRTSKNVDHSFD